MDANAEDRTTARAHLLAAKLARRECGLASALAHLYSPAWQPVLRALGDVLGGRTRTYVAALLRKNREDLCCRPLAMAVAAAAKAGREVLPDALIEGLCEQTLVLYYDRSPWLPHRFLLEMVKTWAQTVVPQLMSQLFDPHMITRFRAAVALGYLQVHEAVPHLATCLAAEDSLVRIGAAIALGNIGTAEAIDPALLRAEQDESVARYLGLGVLRGPRVSDRGAQLAQFLEGKDSRMTLLAARIRMRLGLGLHLPHLLGLLDTEDWDSRVIAAEILGYGEPSDLLPHVIKRSTHDRTLMRWGATLALGRLGTAESVPHLERLARDEDYLVRTAANEALEWNRAGRKVPTVSGWLGYVGNPRLVEQIRSPVDAAEVAHQLGSSCRAVRQAALEAVARSGPQGVVEWAMSSLRAENESDRWYAVQALGEIGTDAALPDLFPLLEDESRHIRQAVALAAERIGWRLRRPIPAKQAPKSIRIRAESLATSLGELAECVEE